VQQRQTQSFASGGASAATAAAAAGVGHTSSTAHSRPAVRDQHPPSSAKPATASEAGAGKGSPGGAAWSRMAELLGKRNMPPSKLQQMGLTRVSVTVF
jgi:hypothetical protein